MDTSAGRETRGRVLIAEDDAFTRGVLALLLRQDGWEVAEASDGKAALRLARRKSPDVVVTDLRMPGMSGIELAREVEAADGLEGVVSIAITSDPSGLREAAVRSSCFVSVLTKPMEPDAFLQAVRQAADKGADSFG